MYIFDKNVFVSLGQFYRRRFPTVWSTVDKLCASGKLRSVREVRREIEVNCPIRYVGEWVSQHHEIFMIPTQTEQMMVRQMFESQEYRDLVKRQNIIRGLPVADPFIIAAGKFYNACVITQESDRGGARIPYLCRKMDVTCHDLEYFFEQENISY